MSEVNFIELIVDKYSDMMMRIAYQNLKSHSDAQDCVQDILLKLINLQKDFESEEHIKAWLIRVTINRCRDILRMSWVKKRSVLTEDYPELMPEETGLIEEVWKLPAKYRNVLYLYYFEDYKITQIADILKMKQATVNTQLQRARLLLKDILLEGRKEDEREYLQECSE